MDIRNIATSGNVIHITPAHLNKTGDIKGSTGDSKIQAQDISDISGKESSERVKDKFVRKPYSEGENRKALEHLKEHGMEGATDAGLFKKGWFSHSRISVDKAMEMLKEGKSVKVKNERGKYSEIQSFEALQELDALKGRGNNTILPGNQFDALKFLEHGRDGDDGLFDPGFFGDKKINSYDALQRMNEGDKLEVNIGAQEKLSANSPQDLAEMDSFYGSGKNTVMSDGQYDSMVYFNKMGDEGGYYVGKEDREKTDAYTALQEMQAENPVYIKNKGKSSRIKLPQDVAELDALEGRGINTILPWDQFEAIQSLSDGFYRDEQRVAGNISAYEALQVLQDGKVVEYRLKGGDFGETIDQDIGFLEKLPDAELRVKNQREYDKYKFSFPEYQEKTGKIFKKTPELTDKALDKAEGEYKRASNMPTQIRERYTTTEYGYYYGYNPSSSKWEYHYGPNTVTKYRWVHNYERDRKMSSAQNKVHNAERVQDKIPQLRTQLKEINKDNFNEKKQELEEILIEMERCAAKTDSKLRKNIKRIKSLLRVMVDRPERPQGWTPPYPRVQEY